MSTIDFQAELSAAGANVRSRWGAVRFFIRRYPLGAGGAVIMCIFLFAAAFAPYITMYDPLSTNAAASLAKPSMAHWLGSDFMGRDMYSRIIYGARISLMVAVGSMVLGSGIGVVLGLLSGYLLGWFDLVTQRVLEMMQVDGDFARFEPEVRRRAVEHLHLERVADSENRLFQIVARAGGIQLRPEERHRPIPTDSLFRRRRGEREESECALTGSEPGAQSRRAYNRQPAERGEGVHDRYGRGGQCGVAANREITRR